MTNDPIADMLTRIRNALGASKTSVSIPYSKIKDQIAKLLKENNFIADYRVSTDSTFKTIEVDLTVSGAGRDISNLTRISKPGRRIYAPAKEIPLILSGRGIVIVSTSKGIMTGREARKLGLGGELICKVW